MTHSIDAPGAHRDDPHFADRARPRIPGAARFVTKPGVRGHPAAPPGAVELAEAAGGELADRPKGTLLVDASGAAGALARVAVDHGREPTGLLVLEPSAASLACAAETLPDEASVVISAGLPWDAPAGIDTMILSPPTDRGSARVRAELLAAAAALADDGRAWIALHKDRGAKRYLRDAERLFGHVEIVARSKGWRVARATDPRAAEPADPWQGFAAYGREFEALPGVFAAGKEDPGTSRLLAALGAVGLSGAAVLDLGCGYGALAVHAASMGAAVVAVDDDLAAVRSTARSAERNGVAVRALHSDLDLAVPLDARFDVVLCNPPFHVGKQVRLDLSQAFVRAAGRRLRRGGELWLVANRQLPYESFLASWSSLDTVESSGAFKVLRAAR